MALRRFWVNPFTTGNPFLATILLEFSIGRGSGALKGLTGPVIRKKKCFAKKRYTYLYRSSRR